MKKLLAIWLRPACIVLVLLSSGATAQDKPINIGGVYPHLAMMNNEGECGTGSWHTLGSLITSPNEMRAFKFYPGVNAHWVRLVSDTDATITATFVYE